jgi:hypothetical protein
MTRERRASGLSRSRLTVTKVMLCLASGVSGAAINAPEAAAAGSTVSPTASKAEACLGTVR